MKREAKLLLEKACGALVLSIKLFNRPHDRGRVNGHESAAMNPQPSGERPTVETYCGCSQAGG
jgi:hypothetical protein